jgi:lia operon protein LiaF
MNRSRLWGGVLLIAVGLLFLLDSMQVADFGDVIRTYWPLILIFFGLRSIIGRSTGHTEPFAAGPEGRVVSADGLHQSAVFGNLDIRVESRSFAGGSASTVFGELDVDLTAVTAKEGQSLLKLSGVLGGIRVRLPRDMEYAVSMNTVLGGLSVGDQRQDGFSPSLRYQTPGYVHASRTLMITASQVMGEISVHTA